MISMHCAKNDRFATEIKSFGTSNIERDRKTDREASALEINMFIAKRKMT